MYRFLKKLNVSISKEAVSVLPVSIPVSLLSFQVSVRLSTYTTLPVPTLKILHDRLRQLSNIPEGI